MSNTIAPAPDQIKDMEPDELLKQYDRLTWKMANRYSATAARYSWIDEEDLRQVAMIALLKAQKGYNPDSGSFVNYACMIIDTGIKAALNIRWTPYGNQFEPETVSLDRPISDDSETTIGELIPGSDEPLDERAVRTDISDRVRAAVHALPDEQEEVIERLYLNSPTETKQQIALSKGLPKQKISNRQQTAFRKLRFKLRNLEPEIPNHIGFQRFNNTWISEPERYVLSKEKHREQLRTELSKTLDEERKNP